MVLPIKKKWTLVHISPGLKLGHIWTNCVERKINGELLPIPQEKLLGKNENGELLPIPREKLLGRKGKWRDSLHNEVKLLGLFAITVHSCKHPRPFISQWQCVKTGHFVSAMAKLKNTVNSAYMLLDVYIQLYFNLIHVAFVSFNSSLYVTMPHI